MHVASFAQRVRAVVPRAIASNVTVQPRITRTLHFALFRVEQHQQCTTLVAGRSFSSASNKNGDVSAILTMDENQFLDLAEHQLHAILEWSDGIEEMVEDADITLSQGVLKMDLAEHGTWVLNRQIPNRQIWWSSPISGPRRYEYDPSTRKWLSTRDKTELFERLQEEISDATGISIFS